MTVNRDREILTSAQEKGPLSTVAAFFRLSGPGWLQSAITLGGGSLIGALYLGMLGGTHMLWLQLVAIVVGVIMLSAIAYVTLSTKVRPYEAINQYVNPVLGIAWITATILANMIWIMPQFGLCFDALEQNLIVGMEDTQQNKIIVSAVVALVASFIVYVGLRPGKLFGIFDWLLKILVAMIVVCFVGVVYYLSIDGQVDWNAVWRGFIPDLGQWNSFSPEIQELFDGPGEQNKYWKDKLQTNQRYAMITVAATAVGLNMTFLLPYSLLARGWDKPFRGLARVDLLFGMAIPYIIVTTCIVIASANAFHAKADAKFLSDSPAEVQQSVMFNKSMQNVIAGRIKDRLNKDTKALAEFEALEGEERTDAIAEFVSKMPESERKLSLAVLKPQASQLAATLEPALGEQNSKWIFGVGAFAMGFSTIVILMVINGYAFAELFGDFQNVSLRSIGAIAAVVTGVSWVWVWGNSESKTWLMLVASSFAAILLPIAYVCFMALMNNRRLLKSEKPTGTWMIVWNLMMSFAVLAAVAQAYGALQTKANDPKTGAYMIGGLITFGLLALVGFTATRRSTSTSED